MNLMAKKRTQPLSTNILDYPSNMSGYEKESLVAEAKLAAKKKRPKSAPKWAAVGKISGQYPVKADQVNWRKIVVTPTTDPETRF